MGLGGPGRAGQPITGAQLADAIAKEGYATVVAKADAMVPGPLKEAMLCLVARIKAHLVTGDVERSVSAYTALTPAEAKAAWAAQQADTPKTYQKPLHLITGVLLPVWDRIPGQPQVVRTQTSQGERLLGRVVRESDLAQTLKNLGVDSKVANMSVPEVLERLMAGEKALLGNGWEIKKVTVSNDTRLEISGHDLSYSSGDQMLLKNMGAYVERIQWTERIFLPTGQAALPVLERLLKAKPLVDLLGKEASRKPGQDDELSDALFSRGEGNAAPVAEQVHLPISTEAADKVVARIQRAFQVRSHGGVPFRIEKVRTMADLPEVLRTSATAQKVEAGKGVFYDGTVYVVEDAHATAKELETTIFHELYGHAATQALFGKEWVQKQNALYDAVGGGQGLMALAQRNGINLWECVEGFLERHRSIADKSHHQHDKAVLGHLHHVAKLALAVHVFGRHKIEPSEFWRALQRVVGAQHVPVPLRSVRIVAVTLSTAR
jgi:hypothetical protein